MRNYRRAMITAAAAVMWGGAGFYVITGDVGDTDGMAAQRTCNFCLSAAVVLTVSLVVTRYVVAPRAAYRLGWLARERHDAGPEAEVIDMRKRRHG